MDRRSLIAGTAALAGASALPRFALGQAARARTLKFVPHANLAVLDPIWTTAYITRNHGLMCYDTLFGVDSNFVPQPQMAEGIAFEDDNKRATITLRADLRFHDNERVTAKDAVASLKRWMKRSPMGQWLEGLTDELVALDDRKLQYRLKKPFPLLTTALGTICAPIPFIMPERLAATDPFQQVREVVGSGPYRFKADEFNSGSLIVYERFAGYAPTTAAGRGLLAGPKVAHFDRVEWTIITDAATAAAALQSGEIDWFEQPPPEIQLLLKRNRNVKVEAINPLPLAGIMRFNHLQPPFDRKEIRRAFLPAVSQEDSMIAVVGTDPENYRINTGVFTPGTPLANDAGLDLLKGERSVDKAKQMLQAAGYKNELIRFLAPTDIAAPAALSNVMGDMMRRIGVNLDFVQMDWGTAVQRRASREPLDKGGWSVLCTAFDSFDFLDPAGHFPLRANGNGAWFGWPNVPKAEELRAAWFEAPDLEAQKKVARELQQVAMDEVIYVPLGSYLQNTGLRRNLEDRVVGPPLFWNIKRS